MIDLVAAVLITGSVLVSVLVSADLGGGLALVACVCVLGVAWRMHQRRQPLGTWAALNWSEGEVRWSVVMAGGLVMLLAPPLQPLGLWLLGLGSLALTVLGLNMRETSYGTLAVTPEGQPVRYWLMLLSYGVVGTVGISAGTYLLGA